jgi:hypothetical protein
LGLEVGLACTGRKDKLMTGRASVTLPGSVEMVIRSDAPNTLETAQTALEGVGEEKNVITIENTLTDKNAHKVHLHSGAKVEVSVEGGEAAVKPHKPWPDMFGGDETK